MDAETLLLHVLGRNKAWLLAHLGDELPEDQAAQFNEFIERRHRGEPIQYITGEQEFYGLPFRVTPDVLIPRPETEHLVEKALELAGGFDRPRIVDVGVGSGAIAVALAYKLPEARMTALDISPAALEVASGNAERNGVLDRIRLLQSDLLTSVADERFEMVVSNPPYVPSTDRDSLSVEVREHEPALALFAAAFAVLEAGGFLLMEIGYGQSVAVGAQLQEAGFERIEFVPDLQGIPRVACGQRFA